MSAAPQRHEHLDALAVGSLLLCCLLWGLNQVAVKAALPLVPPLTQLALRSLIAAALVLVWMRWRGIRWSPRDGTLGPGLLAGGLFATEFALIFLGLQHTTAARSVVFLNASPFVVALVLAAVLPAERLRPLQVGGLVLAFASLVLAFGDQASGGHWLGDLLIIGAAMLWGLTTVVIRLSALSRTPAETTLAYQLVISAVLAPVAAVVAGEAWPASWPPLAWGSLLYQSVIVTFASYLLWFWLLTRYPATKVQSFVFLSPLSGTLFAGWLLGEPVTWQLLVALGGVAVGITLVNKRRPAAAEPAA
jgi:drug/metabolite transporter (DMT)-like permease